MGKNVIVAALFMRKKGILYLILLIMFAGITSQPADAQSNCLPLNNGGQTDKQICPSPTPQTPVMNTTNQQITRRQPVYPISQAKTTPKTGPELIALPSLISLAGLGFFLRNKAKT